MKKNLIQSSILLLIGGCITKLLGMIIKIIMSRNLGIEGLSMYMLVLPTFSFCILLGQAGFPFTLSRMVAYHNKSSSTLYFTVIISLTLYNIFLSILLIVFAHPISQLLLKNEKAYLPIIGIALVIPFTTLSNTLKSYFIGKQKIFPTVLSNITENLLRLFFMIEIIPKLRSLSISFLVFIMILFNIISELCATLILVIYIPKGKKILSYDISLLKESIQISIPQLLSTLIGNGTYFLEPILLFYFLTKDYSIQYVTQEYGIITGYVLPLIFLPIFFVTTIQQVLLPNITHLYKNRNSSKILFLLKIEIICVFIFSNILSICYFLLAKNALFLIYQTSYGITYLKLLSFFLFFIYIEPIYQYIWIALGKTKEIFITTVFSSIIRLFSLVLLLLCNFGIYSLLLSLIINIILTNIFQYYRLVDFLTKKEDKSSI